MSENPAPASSTTLASRFARHVFALLAVAALASAVGLWWYFNQTSEASLRLGAGIELKYRQGLTDILCDEAKTKHLQLEIQFSSQALGALDKVTRHELDAAIIPAGLSAETDAFSSPAGSVAKSSSVSLSLSSSGTAQKAANQVRQVTLMECEALHLFAKPEIAQHGLAGLRGHSIYLGPPGTATRCVAEVVLKFMGFAAGKDFVADSRSVGELLKSPATMPDAVFNLSPLPSPLGNRLARQLGYQLLELPMGEALALDRPACEDIQIPADLYGADPAVPARTIHSIGVRGVLIAHSDVPALAIERLLEVLYDSDFACRANVAKLDPALLKRPGDYPIHRGTRVYMHRDDPFHVQALLSKVQGLIGSTVSVLSAILLAWQWIRRRKVDVSFYQQECTHLDLDAQRAAYLGEFGEDELSACLTQLSRLKAEVLEQYRQQFLAGDKQVNELVSRIEGMQKLLPSLVHSKLPRRSTLDFGPPRRKTG